MYIFVYRGAPELTAWRAKSMRMRRAMHTFWGTTDACGHTSSRREGSLFSLRKWASSKGPAWRCGLTSFLPRLASTGSTSISIPPAPTWTFWAAGVPLRKKTPFCMRWTSWWTTGRCSAEWPRAPQKKTSSCLSSTTASIPKRPSSQRSRPSMSTSPTVSSMSYICFNM